VILPYINSTHKTATDIGCGDLYFTNIFAEHFNGRIYAVDTGFADKGSGDGMVVKLKDIVQYLLFNTCFLNMTFF